MTHTSLSVPDAVARILAAFAPLPMEREQLEYALGHVLAEDVVSPVTLPARDTSAMDGYAVLAEDVRGASAAQPITLPVRETVAAGQRPERPLARGEAVRVMTGAPVPTGTDTVIRQEDTDGGVARVVIRDARDAGKNVRPAGEDVRAGAVALPRGLPIGAAQLGVLASIGALSVPVHRPPRVALFGSGDELVDLDEFALVRDGQRIVDSNQYTISALIRANGGIPLPLGHAHDDPADVREHFERALAAQPDLIVTAAGVSVGEHDYTRTVVQEMGGRVDFWRVRMRPGAPLGFGTVQGVPWFGLPGNPVSAMVTFELFARPAIRRMLGHTRVHRRPVRVTLDEPVTLHAMLTHFLRAIVAPRGADESLGARLTGPQSSGILTSMARANALLVVPEGQMTVAEGEPLHALLLGEAAGLSEQFAL